MNFTKTKIMKNDFKIDFTCDADFILGYENKILTLRLHSLSKNRFIEVTTRLYDVLNETKTP